MKDKIYPKVTPDMSLDEITRILTPNIMINALEEEERMLLILSVLRFDFSELGAKMQKILYGE